MKFIIAHPGTAPFIQQTARALFERGLLASYWTGLADQPHSLWRRLFVHLARIIGIDLDLEFRRREVTEVPFRLVRPKPAWEVVRLLSSKLGCDVRLVETIWECGVRHFDGCVARRAYDNVAGVYGYQFSALATFQEAQRRGLFRIYDVPGPEPLYAERIIQDEIARFPELNDGKRYFFAAREARLSERVRQEWDLANIVIANSKFTADSYITSGFDTKKVRIVHLGAPTPDARGATGGSALDAPLRVLWAGNFDILKGALYLLSAWQLLASKKNATLEIYGANLLPKTLTSNLPQTVSITSTVPRPTLFRHYLSSDVLAFPTLCDGFGMVVTEAFAHGLPVIATARAGAAELVQHKVNGLIVPAGNALALAEAFEWCLTHRSELQMMRHAALETASRWQWHDFRETLVTTIIQEFREFDHMNRD